MSKAIEIVVNEKTLKCSFGLGFLGECLENLDLSVVQIGEKLDKNPFKWIPTLMYECIKYSKDIDFTIDDLLCDYILSRMRSRPDMQTLWAQSDKGRTATVYGFTGFFRGHH